MALQAAAADQHHVEPQIEPGQIGAHREKRFRGAWRCGGAVVAQSHRRRRRGRAET